MPLEPSQRRSGNATAEHNRLREPFAGTVQPWRKWGPYVAERSWATVREDYSPDGNAWDYSTHDLARSKAYRWGEDGIAAICDRYQLLVFALALWNGRDPILKERMFGLSSTEGNHGEDVKEYWFYLDNTPTHSYMRMLYKYPQGEFPYARLIAENAQRKGAEFELLDTGIFDDDRYFDVIVEYAKADPEDICIQIEAINRGPETAELHILPHLWFRNTWAWTDPPGPEPQIFLSSQKDSLSLVADGSMLPRGLNLQNQYDFEKYYFYAPAGEVLFTDNETNAARVYGGWAHSRSAFVKDAFHRYIINHEPCVKYDRGTKACLHYLYRIEPGKSVVLRLRLTAKSNPDALDDVEQIVRRRRQEADEFYETIYPPKGSADERMIQRQALAGLLWSKQVYLFDVERWLEGDNPRWPPPDSRKRGRNIHWRHLNSLRILAVPDKWEFPWFASWDLAFQCVSLALVDPEFAKQNIWLLLFEQFQHPNGQIPAYEWEFSDVNPPVQAWACWQVYKREKRDSGKGDLAFLERCLHKLLINFAWWINRVDSQGNNVFEGGFLGLDNITVLDRGEKLPNGAILEQCDGTGWMAFFCLYLMRIALELAKTNHTYELLATKFFEHFVYIGVAMKNMGGRSYQLWDDNDGFFYDVLRFPNAEFHKLRLRSWVGLVPLFAIEILNRQDLEAHPEFLGNLEWFIRNRADLVGNACYTTDSGGQTRYVLSLADSSQFKRLAARLWDPGEFLSPYGIRSLSKYHRDHPFGLGEGCVGYEPSESHAKIKGGNSNWRGPIWFPTSYLLIHSLQQFSDALGPSFTISQSDDNEAGGTPRQLAEEIANRMIAIFARDASGRRPCFGASKKMQNDPYWRDYLLFNEYFHGDSGAGLGASHQTGWTGLVANLIDEWRR